ncbi:BTAD domain-containing putative transcriptional regulator [Actinokineospora iranica]|uniref:DNA-binding transcriptional activator of the SARP family n=1 Tax=Actinokineospora iranica TaxID=1271860 RepID=A0A1G6RXL0_9PSEU|nr:BTAD domain-containing putative transcriptional regulator [Actinokineospora iranica]SDD09402.1 DNA-binding transcriptional activator of the SARP family [Actinokineospora iranica]
MQFRVLGPLEATLAERAAALGGTKQRATLGFLLLHANHVVATSQLLRALWPEDEMPTSARKILQNAVWGLRGVLDLDGGSTRLTTKAPGYMLQVDDERVDLYRFHHLIAQGRAELAAGKPAQARQLLRDALGLWRGPALADLVEIGIAWPKLAEVQSARLDALEDCFEAELGCGRHQAVLGELESMVAAEPLRERSCGQLMLALYRCGRQADALSVYARVRAALVEDLGLEPGHDLQRLQHAILTHDEDLIRPVAQRDRERMTQRERLVVLPPLAEPAGEQPPVVPSPRAAAAERRLVTVVLVRTQPADGSPERVDEILELANAVIREQAERAGGVVAASIGSVSLVVFGTPDARDGDSTRAVHAALDIRRGLAGLPGTLTRSLLPAPELAVRIAVATGAALVRENGSLPSVNGALLDECQALLARVAPGQIRVCARTRQLTWCAIQYHHVEEHPGEYLGDNRGDWQVRRALDHEHIAPHTMPIIDRERELEVLRGLLERAGHRARPHLVTVFGEAGIGKTRFVMEFERRVAVHAETARFLVGRVRPFAEHNELAVLAETVFSYCGATHDDYLETKREKLAGALQRLVAGEEERAWLLSRLGCLLDLPSGVPAGVDVGDLLRAWRCFLEAVAARRPLVVVIDDLHWAGEQLLGFVEDMAESARPVPLLVVVTARPELLERRPGWGGGQRHSATITLDPLSDAAIDRLLEYLEATTDRERADTGGLIARPQRDLPDARRDGTGTLVMSALDTAGDDWRLRRV